MVFIWKMKQKKVAVESMAMNKHITSTKENDDGVQDFFLDYGP